MRGGTSLPLDAFEAPPTSGGALSGSGAFGAAFHLDRGLGFGLVLGFSQYRASCDGAGCAADDTWVSTQWELGTRWTPVRRRVSPWIQAALAIPRIEHAVGSTTTASKTSFGLEGGAGFAIRITERWSLVPAVRWLHFDADLAEAGSVPVTFLTGDAALRVVF